MLCCPLSKVRIKHSKWFNQKNGKTTDEKDIRLWGVIDTECRVVEKFHLKTESK